MTLRRSAAARQRSASAHASSAEHRAQRRLDARDRAGRHRQLTEAEPDQQHRLHGVAGHLAAHRERSLRAARAARAIWARVRSTAGCSGSYRLETRGSVRSTASRYWIRSFVPTLKKSTSAASRSAITRRARHLEVHADRHVLAELEPRRRAARARLLEQGQRDAQVGEPADEGEHDAHRPVGARPQQRAQLHAERLRRRRSRRSARSPSAGFGLDGPGRPERLEADVPGAHRDRVRVHLLEQAAVDVDLLVLARPAQAPAEQVLGAEQPDALRRRAAAPSPPPRGTRRSPRAGPRRRRACAPAARACPAAAPPRAGTAPAPRGSRRARSPTDRPPPRRSCRRPPPGCPAGSAAWRPSARPPPECPSERAMIAVW